MNSFEYGHMSIFIDCLCISGLLLCIDFEKAFVTVSWDFLFKTLYAFNFGQNLVKKWVQVCYTNITSGVINNGTTTGYFYP